jgi:DNA-binding MarR family transcriptional regulator
VDEDGASAPVAVDGGTGAVGVEGASGRHGCRSFRRERSMFDHPSHVGKSGAVGNLNLTPTSYLVLGLLGAMGPSTSYDLKRAVNRSIGEFWSFPHSQLYAEPVRLAAAGLLVEEREEKGRRRRLWSITAAGRDALDAWLAEPTGSGRSRR